MKTNKNTFTFRDYGEITVPAGTPLTHKTARDNDENYNFVDRFDWIDENYPTIATFLKHDAQILWYKRS